MKRYLIIKIFSLIILISFTVIKITSAQQDIKEICGFAGPPTVYNQIPIQVDYNGRSFTTTNPFSITSTAALTATLTVPAGTTVTNGSQNIYTFYCFSGCDSVVKDDSSGNWRCNVSAPSSGGIKLRPIVICYNKQAQYDLSVELDIRSFICKNKDFDQFQSFWNENSSTYASYAPSTTYATKFYNEVASSTCPESQINRPVEFSATAKCLQGNCPSARLQIKIEPENPNNYGIPDSTDPKYETKIFETSYDATYPKSIKGIYIFNNAYNYKVTASFVDQNNNPININDADNSNNSKEQTLRIFDYICWYGFSAQTQRDWNNPPLYLKILKIFGTTDSPTRYWRNEICRAQIGFNGFIFPFSRVFLGFLFK